MGMGGETGMTMTMTMTMTMRMDTLCVDVVCVDIILVQEVSQFNRDMEEVPHGTPPCCPIMPKPCAAPPCGRPPAAPHAHIPLR